MDEAYSEKLIANDKGQSVYKKGSEFPFSDSFLTISPSSLCIDIRFHLRHSSTVDRLLFNSALYNLQHRQNARLQPSHPPHHPPRSHGLPRLHRRRSQSHGHQVPQRSPIPQEGPSLRRQVGSLRPRRQVLWPERRRRER